MRDSEGEKGRSLVFSCRIRMVQQRLRKGPHFSSEGVSPREIRNSLSPLFSLPPPLSLSLSEKNFVALIFLTHISIYRFHFLSLSLSLNNDYLNNESDKMSNGKEIEPHCCTDDSRGVSLNRDCTRF